MNVEDDFEPRDSSTETGESPEDFLFAVPEESEDSAPRNPYDADANSFDDETFPDHSMGPCSFEMESAGNASPGNPSSELASLFLDDDELPSGGDDQGGVPHGGMPGLITHSYEMPPEDSGTPPGADSFGGAASGAAAGAMSGQPAKRDRVPPAQHESQTIPGRSNRVSYSQAPSKPAPKPKVSGVGRKEFRPVIDQPTPRSATQSSMFWMVPFAAFLSGSCFAAYYFLQVGSPVLAGVTSTLGVIAALFCRVLFRR